MNPRARVRSLSCVLGLSVAALALIASTSTAGGPPAKARPEVDQALARLAAGRSDVQVRRSRRGFLRFIAARRGRGFALSSSVKSAPPEQRAHAFIAAHGTAFGLGQKPDTAIRRVTPRDRVGLEHVRVQQMYRGIPVTGAEMIVHLDGDSVRAANGHLLDVEDIGDLDVTPSLTDVRAQAIAAGVVRDTYSVTAPRLAATRLEVFNRGILDRSDAPTCLAWFVEVQAPGVREYVWVDAQDGSVLLHFNQKPHALNRTIYDGSVTYPGVVVRTEGQPPTGDAEADALYSYLGSAYDYYMNEHGRDSYDGAGAPVVGVAHLSADNAWWNDDDARFEFGNGYPMADDIVAHEFTHAVDDFTANLYYSYEPGALNESFSDMFGETVDLLNSAGNDGPEVRWLFGEDMPGMGAGRDMMEPNAFGNPGRVSDPLFHCEWEDFYGVHYNSAVPSHAYALMVDGGTYNAHTVHGIGLHKAGHIAYRALATYLTSASGFQEASDAFEQACNDLVGQQGIVAADCAEVQHALEAVEMPDARSCHAVYVRIRTAGPGSGKITMLRDPDWVECSPVGACDANFPEGEPIRLLAIADPGSIFSGWAGDGCTGTLGDCRPFVSGDTMEIVAVFDPDGSTHPLNVSMSGSTTGALVTSDPAGISCGTDCSEIYPAGTFVTLTATAAPGSVLAHWGGACSGVGPTCTLAMTGAMNVTAEFGPAPFSVESSLGSGSIMGGAAWGDYDGDGDLDIVLADRGHTIVYRNDGGSFVDIGAPLPVLADGMAVAWGDYDNDGDIDLAVSGNDVAHNDVLKVFRNDAGTFVDSGMTWPGVGETNSLSWVDYDNDGDLDLALSGDGPGPAALLRNDHGVLVNSAITFPPAHDMQWGDYDADGDLDVMVAYYSTGGMDSYSTLYRNDGGTFVDSGMAADPAASPYVAWVDYDSDGHLDLTVNTSPMLHRNVGGELTPVTTDIPDGWDFTWGDADADGDWDLLRLGVPRPTSEWGLAHDSLVIENGPGGIFTPIASGLPEANGAHAYWGDYDNDGRLDLYLHSANAVCRSSHGSLNTPPQPPTSATAVLSADGVRLAWSPGSDAQTPSTGLSYNVRVGTTTFGSEIVSAMSDALTGRRFVASTGNAGSNLFYVLKDLAPGHYYYTVQSVDTSFAGSGFINGSFDYPPSVSTAVQITDDWGTGYCANLTVTNISSASVTGWQSSFALPGGSAATITNLWSFQYTQNGAIANLQPRWFNRTIAAGQSVTGRFCADGPTGAKYDLQVLINGLGQGSVSSNPVGIECGLDCSESYPGGTAVTLTATPDFGSTFLRWEGACSGSQPTCTITMGPGGASTMAFFMPATSSNVTVTPVVAQSQPYYNEEHVRIKNPTALTALSVTIVIQRTPGLWFNGLFNTVGGQIQQSHSETTGAITYSFTLTPGQTVWPGEWTFAAQTNGNGTPHPTSGDTYSVTYTVEGRTYTQTGTF
jgi:Zn-dependent metalloprotease